VDFHRRRCKSDEVFHVEHCLTATGHPKKGIVHALHHFFLLKREIVRRWTPCNLVISHLFELVRHSCSGMECPTWIDVRPTKTRASDCGMGSGSNQRRRGVGRERAPPGTGRSAGPGFRRGLAGGPRLGGCLKAFQRRAVRRGRRRRGSFGAGREYIDVRQCKGADDFAQGRLLSFGWTRSA